jgi:cation diffusion facilitator CzcD-associated flavoprotein CzcO
MTDGLPNSKAHGPDISAMRARYRRERDIRLRSDGNNQFRELEGVLARFQADPWIQGSDTRSPADESVDVAIIGGGFGGLLAGGLLRDAGVQSLRIIEKGADFGGVWYWNRYPGVQCDIDATVYLPLLEKMGYTPTEKYASGQEIFQYCQAIGQKYGLYRDAYFQTEVTNAQWAADKSRWVVSTDRGDRIEARFLITSPGSQHRPRLPAIQGIESFRGRTFHTSRWDYEYTGGGPSAKMDRLGDKRVGVVGTGCTALQCVPGLAETSQHLYVFQRTPSAVLVRAQRPLDPKWATNLEMGWQARRMENFISILTGGKVDEDLVDDGWTHAMRALGPGPLGGKPRPGLDPAQAEMESELADFELMEQIRARVSSIVEDPVTAEALKPYYRFLCKRPGFSDVYLQAFNRANVTLIDTKGRGVERMTESGVVADSREIELDCVVFATGFDVGKGYIRTAGFEVEGRDGLRLSEYWENGPRTFHGFHSHGFPNCFFMGNTQTGINVNFVHALWEQAKHLSYLVAALLERGIDRVEATPDAQRDWCAIFDRRFPGFIKFQSDCTPGYFNNEGKTDDRNGLLAARYPDGALEFFRLLERWRTEGETSGLDITPHGLKSVVMAAGEGKTST